LNTRKVIASIINSLKILDQQKQFKIADKIFNNLKTAQEVEEKKVEPKTLQQLIDELSTYNVSPEALKAGFKSLLFKYHPDLYNNDPIANENTKLLNKAYSTIKMKSFQDDSDEEDEDGQKLSSLSIIIEEASADIKLDLFNNERMKFSPNQVIQAYKDHLLWNIYYKEGMLDDRQNIPPVKISFIEKDLKKIASGIYYAAFEEYNDLKEVKVGIKYRIDGESNIKYYFKNFSEDNLQIAGTSTAQLN
jgi:hypothetical protein